MCGNYKLTWVNELLTYVSNPQQGVAFYNNVMYNEGYKMKWHVLGQDYLTYTAAWTTCLIHIEAGMTCKVRALNNGKYQVMIYE